MIKRVILEVTNCITLFLFYFFWTKAIKGHILGPHIDVGLYPMEALTFSRPHKAHLRGASTAETVVQFSTEYFLLDFFFTFWNSDVLNNSYFEVNLLAAVIVWGLKHIRRKVQNAT